MKTQNKSIIGQEEEVRLSNLLHDEEELDFSDALAALRNKKYSDLFGKDKGAVNIKRYDPDDGTDELSFVEVRNADGSLLCTASYYGGVWRMHIKRKHCMTSIYLHTNGTMEIQNY